MAADTERRIIKAVVANIKQTTGRIESKRVPSGETMIVEKQIIITIYKQKDKALIESYR